MKTYRLTFLILLLIGSTVTVSFAQDIVCPSVTYRYTSSVIPDNVYVRLQWSTSGTSSVTIVNAYTRDIVWAGDGSVTWTEQDREGTGKPWTTVGSTTVNVSMTTAGNIVGADIVCPNTSITLINRSGVGSSFSWQSSPSAQNAWTNFALRSANSSIPFSVTQKTDFRIVNNDCATASVSGIITADVYGPVTSPGSIAGGTNICSGSAPPTFTNSSGAVSYNNAFLYQWQSRPTGTSTWTDISGVSAPTYSSGALTQSTDFQRLAKWDCNLSQYMATTPITVWVDSPSVGGSLTPGSPPSFCQNGTMNMTLVGSSGSISWWYTYNDNGTVYGPYQIAGTGTTNSLNVTTDGINTRIYSVYCKVKSGVCDEVTSTTLPINVYQSSLGGTVSSTNGTSFCQSGFVNLTLSGSRGYITWWYKFTDDGVNYGSPVQISGTGITNALGVTTDGSHTRTYSIYATVNNGACSSVNSSPALVTTYPISVGGAVTSTNGTTFCQNGNVNLSLTGQRGSIAWVYTYTESGVTSGPFGISGNGTTNTLAVSTNGSVNRTYNIYCQLTNGVCAAVSSTPASILVYAPITSASISPALIEGYSSVSSNITLSGFPPTASSFTWQSSPDGTSWTNITNNGSDPTVYGVVTNSTTWYRTYIVNGTCSGYSSNSKVIVSQFPVIATIPPGAPTYLAIGNTLTLGVNTNYGVNYNIYQWANQSGDIPLANNSTYTASEPGIYTVRVTSSSTAPPVVSAGFTVYAMGMQPNNSVNAVVTTLVRQSGVNQSTDLYTLPNDKISQSIQYLDMQSRPIQTVAIGQSPQQKDIVLPYRYDTLSSISYLPYVAGTRDGSFRTTAISNGTYTNSDQYKFYTLSSPKIANDPAPYAITTHESSPLAWVIEQGAPGTDWQPGGHTVKPGFHTNLASNVKIWTTSGPSGYYSANTLAMNSVKDENGNPVVTFSDKLGRTILKRVKTSSMPDTTTWLETYYVYDTRGNLALQVPPKVSSLLNNGTAWSPTLRDTWCFSYKYNVRNNIEQKQVPGAAIVYYVYDTLGRLVLTQDGNLRATNQWAFVKYDMKGRAVMSGLYTNATQTTLSGIKGIVKVLYPNNASPWYEERSTALHGYTNQSFPMTNADGSALQIFSVNYFDNYDFDFSGTDDYSYTSQGITGESAQGKSFGMPTGSKRLVIDAASWLYSYVFYDRFERVIQVRSNNHLSLTVDNLSTVVYDFEGKVLQTKTYHNAGGTNQTTVVKKMCYDAAGRPTKIYQNINNEANDQLVAQYNYNELGQVVEKNLHLLYDPLDGQTGTLTADNLVATQYKGESSLIARNSILLEPGYAVPAGTLYRAAITSVTQAQAEANGRFLQSVDYRYNIRGWLTSINNAQLATNPLTNDDTNDYFGLELAYNTDAGIGNSKFYNGNIGAVKWKNAGVAAGVADQRSYAYSYDASDKLKAATFQANNGSGWTKESSTLNETMSYDHNGNILTLTRNQNLRDLSIVNNLPVVTSAPQTMDNLLYTYASGNQLSKVEDSGTTEGFNNGASNTTEYAYGTLGSLTKDDNKGISSITYNVLGKAQLINFSNGNTISYTYDASGNKLTMTSTVIGKQTTTNYVGAFVYNTVATTSTLNFFSSPEGRVVKNGSNFEYQYAITDHQGNTRVLFTSAAATAVQTLANFDGDANDQESQFQNVPTPIPSTAANHTPGGSYVVRINQNNPVGPALNKKVFPGDVINMEVYSYFEDASGFGTSTAPLTSMIVSVAGAFGGVAGAPDYRGQIYNGVNSALTQFGTGANQGDDAPAAFLNYILFDKNYKVMTAGWKKVVGPSFSKQYDSIANIRVKEAGYLFAYLSYEDQSNNWVYFDDFKVTITPTNILQSNEYYPFGLQTANSWTRDNTINNFLANGGTELNTTSQLYDLDYRNYDPILGRMNQVDPLADRYGSHTPYNYAFNNPVSFNDPNGAEPKDPDPDFLHYVQLSKHVNPFNGMAMWTPSGSWIPGFTGLEDDGLWGDAGGDTWGTPEDGAMTASYEQEIYSRAASGDAGALQTYGQIYGQEINRNMYGVVLADAQNRPTDAIVMLGELQDSNLATTLALGPGPGKPFKVFSDGSKAYKDVNGKTYYVDKDGKMEDGPFETTFKNFWGTDMGQDIIKTFPFLGTEKGREGTMDVIEDGVDIFQVIYDIYKMTPAAPGPYIPGFGWPGIFIPPQDNLYKELQNGPRQGG